MKKHLIPILLAVPLVLAACGSPAETEATPAPTTVTVTETISAKSEEEELEDLDHLVNKALPTFDVTEENLTRECILAIYEKLPDAGNFDFSDPIDFGEISPESDVHFAGDGFHYEDANGEWTKGGYYCSVHSKDGTITEAEAFAY